MALRSAALSRAGRAWHPGRMQPAPGTGFPVRDALASDAERERCASALRDAFAEGRLELRELEGAWTAPVRRAPAGSCVAWSPTYPASTSHGPAARWIGWTASRCALTRPSSAG